MTAPRQVIYRQSILGVIFSLIKKRKKQNQNKIRKLLGIKDNYFLHFTSKGRMALFHIISHVIKKKKRVLLSSFTIFDLINIVKSAGGEPVFIDQKKNSFELDEYLVKKECDKNDVGAIILTHYSLNSNNLEIIRKICKDKNIALIQDLAISPFSRFKQKSLIEYSDYSFFSFGTFKFVSIFFGGALISKKNDIRETIKKKELNWAYYSFKDYYFQFIKSILIKILTSNFIFKLFTFPIFKYAEKFQFKFILNFSKNDPNPINYSSIINDHKKKLPEYNIKVLESLIPYALKDIKVRKRNYEFLFNNIKCKSLILFNPFNFDHEHSYINFPILVKKNKKSFIRYIFENNLDLAYYYYRDCSSLDVFKNIKNKCSNCKEFVNKLIFLPIHPKIKKSTLEKYVKVINKYK